MSCILIAGQIAAGKSSVARGVAEATGSELVLVRVALAEVLGLRDADRTTLQVEGAALDKRTNGRWLVEYLQERILLGSVVVDSMRTARQTTPVLEWVPGAVLIYLDASTAARRFRFKESAISDPVKRSLNFERSMEHETEREARALRSMAHLIVETDSLTLDETVKEVVSGLPPFTS